METKPFFSSRDPSAALDTQPAAKTEEAYAQEYRFQTAGATADSVHYLERETDRILTDTLLAGESCVLLSSRQVGKSSTIQKTQENLRKHNRRAAIIDLQAIGTEDVTEDAWCYGFAREMAEYFQADIDISDLWDSEPTASPTQHLQFAIEAIIHKHPSQPLVLFIDETDLLFFLSFRKDVVQTLLALCDRKIKPDLSERLTICFVSPRPLDQIVTDLDSTVDIPQKTIQLRDFTRDELTPLERGLLHLGAPAKELVTAVYQWTNGHPGLTQTICKYLLAQGELQEFPEQRVTTLVEKRFLTWNHGNEPILLDIERDFSGTEDQRADMLTQWQLIRNGAIPYDAHTPSHGRLLTCGIAKLDGPNIVPRNALFVRVFDEEWIKGKQ